MKIKIKLYSMALASVFLILFLILISSTASASTVQGTSLAGPYAYILNSGNNFSVIDTATNTITATVPIETTDPFFVAYSNLDVEVTPDDKMLYVTNGNTHNVYAINTTTNNVTATIPVGAYTYPLEVAVTPDGTKVYVTDFFTNTVSVIDTATNTITATVAVGTHPSGVVVTPDGTKVYVANSEYWDGTVSVINTTTNKVTSTVPVGYYPRGVAVTPDGTKVYVTNCNSNNVSVIDTATNTVTATVPVGQHTEGVAVCPDGKKVYVTGSNVFVIDTATNTVTATVPVGNSPEGVAVTPDGTKVYVVNYYSNSVSVIDTVTNKVTATLNVGMYPSAFGQFIGHLQKTALPVANFSANVTAGNAPLSIQFNDSSEYTTSVNWDFGDGKNSTERNPVHEFIISGTYTVNLTATNENGTSSKLATINVTEKSVTPVDNQVIPPQSISEIQSSPASTWINWIWINPDDPNFDHTEIYLNGSFQANTSAEYFNTTNLQPETDYTIGTRTADIYGNVNEIWINASAKTKSLPDIDQTVTDIDLPVIESVTLFPANTTGGSKMDVSANIKDNTGVTKVMADNTQLMNVDGNWQGNITAPSSPGKYSLSIKANDAAENTVDTSVPYNVVRRHGSVNIDILPTVSKVVAGENNDLAIKVKNTQNIDDTFKVQISVNGLPAFYRAGASWFDWTEETVNLKANEEVLIPVEMKVPVGTVTGLKVLKANVNSKKFSVRGSDNGYLVISRPSKNINKQIGPKGLWLGHKWIS